MTYREIAEALLARNRKAQTLDVALMSKFVQKVREALFFPVSSNLWWIRRLVARTLHDLKPSQCRI